MTSKKRDDIVRSCRKSVEQALNYDFKDILQTFDWLKSFRTAHGYSFELIPEKIFGYRYQEKKGGAKKGEEKNGEDEKDEMAEWRFAQITLPYEGHERKLKDRELRGLRRKRGGR